MPRDLTIVRFEPALVADHFAVTGGDAEGGCHCAFWDLTEQEVGPKFSLWLERTPAQNRAASERTIAAGRMHGLLAYLDDRPVGWCRFGRRSDHPRVELRFGRSPEPDVGCVLCFSVLPEARTGGVAQALLARAIDEMRSAGLRAIEGYPAKNAREPSENWRGPPQLFERLGFEPVAEGGSFRVMRLSPKA